MFSVKFSFEKVNCTKVLNMNKWVSVLAALVCLCAPSLSRSWVGIYDHDYDRKHDFEHKSWVADPNDGPQHRSNRGWSPDFDSREDSWGSRNGYEDYVGHGYGNDKFDNFGHHHNHEGHNFNHHGDYEYHHHQGFNHQGHGLQKHDNKHDYNGHPSRPHFTPPPSFGVPQNNKEKARDNQANPIFPISPLSPEQNNENNKEKARNNQENPIFPISLLSPEQNTGSPAKPGVPQNGQNREPFLRNNDRVIFPDSPTPNLSTTRSPPPPSSTQKQATSAVPSSPELLNIIICIRACPATPEFNPVCGTNNVTYNNLGALECTKNCGVKVALSRRAPCPQPLPPAFHISVAMISTETPLVNARLGEKNSSAPISRSLASAQPVKPTVLSPVAV